MKGYKAFNSDWTCMGKQYTCPGVFKDCEPGKLKICDKGIHFCEKLIDCFSYYEFSEKTKIAEVEALGEIVSGGEKKCTNEIRIIREVPWDEVLELVNTGKENSGNQNSGDGNSGNWNSGNWNSGNWNSGDRNSGNQNSGNWNSGNRNSGDWNSGDYNSGDYNSGDYNSGCFNTEVPKILLFNKQSDWTFSDWIRSEACYVMSQTPQALKWIPFYNMTDNEKRLHPKAKIRDGYLCKFSHEELKTERNKWWRNLSDEKKQAVLSLPNFDAKIFKECTLIDVTEGNDD